MVSNTLTSIFEIHWVFLLHTAVNIGFSMPTHNVQESSESVDVCVSLVGNTAIPITIDFSTMDGSATGKHHYHSLCSPKYNYGIIIQNLMTT